ATQAKTEASIAVATRSASHGGKEKGQSEQRRDQNPQRSQSRPGVRGGTRVGPSPCEVVEERRDGRRRDDKGGDGEHAPEGAIGLRKKSAAPDGTTAATPNTPRNRRSSPKANMAP